MRSRLSRIGLVFLSFNLLLLASPTLTSTATSATPVTIFDGTYEAYEVITVTVTIPTNPPTTKKITSTSPKFYFTVVNGKFGGTVSGFILNTSGSGTMTLPVPGYGSMKISIRFIRNGSTRDVTLTGTINGTFPTARTVITGKLYGHIVDKFKFTVPSVITPAKIGKRYSGYSFCTPKIASGAGCGWPAKSTNPTGGKAPYTFRLKVGSFTGGGDLLPNGLVLNFKSGQISGTPIKGLKPRVNHLVVCAYDANDLSNGVCRQTTLVLGP